MSEQKQHQGGLAKSPLRSTHELVYVGVEQQHTSGGRKRVLAQNRPIFPMFFSDGCALRGPR